MNKNAELQLQLALPDEFRVVSAKIEEGISELTKAAVEIASVRDLVVGSALEAPAVLALAIDLEVDRTWTLRVNHIEYIGDVEGSFRYRVHLRPELYLLTYTTNTRKFRKMSSKAIITQVLDEHGIKHEWQLTREPEERKYCAQYRETNLAFVSRLLEFEGIFYWFKEDGTIVFGDNSPSAPVVKGRGAYDLIEAGGAMVWQHTGLHRVAKGREVASGTATVNDFNWKKKSLKLISAASAADDAELDFYDYPVGYRKLEQGARIAQQRLEAYRVPARYFEGDGNVESFTPLSIFTYTGNVQPRFAGEYMLQRVTHQFWNRKYSEQHAEGGSDTPSEGFSYRNTFHAIPKDVKFRPPLKTPYPEVEGCHTGMVRGPEGEEIHTDPSGRQKIQFHWDRDAVGTDEDSRWLRNNQEIVTGMVVARVGWEQSIAYINGDPDRPFAFARNINGVMAPEYGQPSNKTRMTVKSPSYPNYGGFNELRLEDSAGAMHFDWHAQRDYLGTVYNDRNENVGNDHTHHVGRNWLHNVGNDQDHTISGNLTTKIGADNPISIEANREFTVGGNEESEIGEAQNAACQSDDTETVTGNKKTKAGKDEEGSITRTIIEELKWTIGTNFDIKAEGNIQTVIQKDFTETIGASKIVKCEEGGIGGVVMGKAKQVVTRNTIRKAEKGMGYSAEISELKITGVTKFISDEQLTVRGNHIQLESTEEIKLQQGDVMIKLTPSQVKVKGNMTIDAGVMLRCTGSDDNMTD